MNKIDVHVLLLPGTDKKLWGECLETLKDEPVNLHILDGIQGHIGKGRYNGFVQGDSPYVSCVDPDDLVIPGAFAACLEALENNPTACGAYTDELIIDMNGEVIKPGIWSKIPWNPLRQLEPKYLHHIYVMRRSMVEKYYLEILRWRSMTDYVLKCLLSSQGPWIHVDQFGYKWRMKPGSAHTQFPPSIVCAAQWRVIPVLREVAKKYKSVLHVEPF